MHIYLGAVFQCLQWLCRTSDICQKIVGVNGCIFFNNILCGSWRCHVGTVVCNDDVCTVVMLKIILFYENYKYLSITRYLHAILLKSFTQKTSKN